MKKLSPRISRHICLALIVMPILITWLLYLMNDNGIRIRRSDPSFEWIVTGAIIVTITGWLGYLYLNIRVFNSERTLDKITSPIKVLIAGGIAAFIVYACWFIFP
ncbi:hypothetical protein [Mucilaginibacter gilvus]|uniref:Uncharacterized protein n=1 Tax=Mucilaginibacter gilvus TaxID=2305909 RepID=A0A3S4YAN1_9SPHI|nr:hypothetical protein [Mucilaginibacter gilvus]RWY50986.1 hypothetical protein EPL05_13015 [Mucilaginibacter gilvus]